MPEKFEIQNSKIESNRLVDIFKKADDFSDLKEKEFIEKDIFDFIEHPGLLKEILKSCEDFIDENKFEDRDGYLYRHIINKNLIAREFFYNLKKVGFLEENDKNSFINSLYMFNVHDFQSTCSIEEIKKRIIEQVKNGFKFSDNKSEISNINQILETRSNEWKAAYNYIRRLDGKFTYDKEILKAVLENFGLPAEDGDKVINIAKSMAQLVEEDDEKIMNNLGHYFCKDFQVVGSFPNLKLRMEEELEANFGKFWE